MENTATTFNFRHILSAIGLTPEKKRNWAIGQMLRAWAAEKQVEINRPLTAKTNSGSKVAAPHCICAYPIEHIADAIEYVKTKMDGEDPEQYMLNL